jgi:hypothetical protein
MPEKHLPKGLVMLAGVFSAAISVGMMMMFASAPTAMRIGIMVGMLIMGLALISLFSIEYAMAGKEVEADA